MRVLLSNFFNKLGVQLKTLKLLTFRQYICSKEKNLEKHQKESIEDEQKLVKKSQF